jgi:hypothetical protein
MADQYADKRFRSGIPGSARNYQKESQQEVRPIELFLSGFRFRTIIDDNTVEFWDKSEYERALVQENSNRFIITFKEMIDLDV